MKRIFYYCCIGITLLFSIACSEKKEKNILIDLDQSFPTKQLRLSDLADNIRCIPLETNGDFILPDNTINYWISDKYIVSICNKAIRLFSPDGKFIRKVATAGKGPDEFSQIFCYTVDEDNDVLYCVQMTDWKNILAIDLQGKQGIKKVYTGCLPRYIQTIQGNILCVSFNYRNEVNCDAVLVNPEGKIIDSIPTTSTPTGSMTTEKLSLEKNNENALFIRRNDTLLHFNFKSSTPIMAFRYANKFDPDIHPEGVQWDICFKTKDYVLMQKTSLKLKENSSSSMLSMKKEATLLIDARNLQPSKISQFTTDLLEEQQDEFPFILTGKKLVRTMSAFEVKKLARTQRENGKTLSPTLQQLDEQLTEESNPVLIVGDLR